MKAAGATTVVGLAGCSGDGSSDGDSGGTIGSSDQNNGGDEVTLTFGTHLHKTPEQKEVLFDLLYELGLPERISIESTFPSGSPDQVKQVWDRQLRTGGRSPDVMAVEVGWIKNYARRGWVENLSELLPSSMVSTVQDEFFPGHVEAAMLDGDLYAVSAFPGFPTTMYNKPLLEEAGYDPEGEDWASKSLTWKRLSNIAADVVEQTDAEIGYTCAANNSLQTSVGTFPESMHSFGGSWFGGLENRFGPVGDRPVTVDDDPSIKAVQMYQRFMHGAEFSGLEDYAGGIMPSAATNWNHQDANLPFMDGNAVFLRNFPFALSLIANELGQEKMGVMPNPKGVDEG
ncbi:MAG: extracellular solute-binding protein, partial [Natronomonas sp.]|uniref:ABC transporter substrate-binding protein n=1 Tax=Natronomonas sp. TaxID=2184060 RepID=UPI0028708A49